MSTHGMALAPCPPRARATPLVAGSPRPVPLADVDASGHRVGALPPPCRRHAPARSADHRGLAVGVGSPGPDGRGGVACRASGSPISTESSVARSAHGGGGGGGRDDGYGLRPRPGGGRWVGRCGAQGVDSHLPLSPLRPGSCDTSLRGRRITVGAAQGGGTGSDGGREPTLRGDAAMRSCDPPCRIPVGP